MDDFTKLTVPTHEYMEYMMSLSNFYGRKT